MSNFSSKFKVITVVINTFQIGNISFGFFFRLDALLLNSDF